MVVRGGSEEEGESMGIGTVITTGTELHTEETHTSIHIIRSVTHIFVTRMCF